MLQQSKVGIGAAFSHKMVFDHAGGVVAQRMFHPPEEVPSAAGACPSSDVAHKSNFRGRILKLRRARSEKPVCKINQISILHDHNLMQLDSLPGRSAGGRRSSRLWL